MNKTNNINRRDLLLLLGATSAVPTLAFLPTSAHALLPAPPPSPYYLWFIANGIYRISRLYTVKLPASAGTCRSYNATVVSQAFGAHFSFTGRHGFGAWQLMTNAPSFEWWEVLDKRNGRYLKFYKYDRMEAKFADGSRVKVVFNGPNSTLRFQPLVGSERLPDGTRLHPRDGDGGGCGKTRECSGSGIIMLTPSITMFSWSWSSQQTPW